MGIHDKVKALANRKGSPAKPAPQAPPPAAPTVDPSAALRVQLADLDRQRSIEAAEAQARIAKLEAEQRAREAELTNSRIRESVRSAARKAGAIDEDDAADLIMARAKIKSEKDRIYVADKPDVTVDAYVAETLAAKPHLLKPRTAQGGGASPFPTAPLPAPGAPDLTTAEGLTQYARSLTHSKPQSPAQ